MQAPALEEKILLIDDDFFVRDFFVHTIEFGTNRHVATFESGFHAWQCIEKAPDNADVVIADANIPDISGMELLERVKKQFPRIVFIIMSSNPAYEKTAFQMGADAFLSKPFDVNDLFAIIHRFILAPPPPSAHGTVPF
jgi:YesN/AraC family two-component response regulator